MLLAALPLLLVTTSGVAHAARPPGLRLEAGRPLRYDVQLDVDPSAPTFSGRMDLRVALDAPTTRLWLRGRDLVIAEATLEVDGVTRPVRVAPERDESLAFSWAGRVQGEATLHVSWTGPVVQDGPYGLFHAEAGGHDLLYTQFEAQDARRMVPSFDEPAFKTPWQLTVRVPDGLLALTNAPEVSRVDDGDHDVYRFAETPPLPTYLVALVVGTFDVVDAGVGGRGATPIRIVVPAGQAEEAAWAAQVTGPILAALEDWFDMPYPFAKLDVVGIPNAVGFGAMEHPGLVTFEGTTLAAPAATDTVSRRRRYVEYQAHELAHQWFGNLVTLPWWDELWLNESFASWMGSKTVAALYPEWPVEYDRIATREAAMADDSLATARRIRQPIVDEGDVDEAFDGITYAKGEVVLGMFEAWIGPEAFRAGVRRYLAERRYGSGTTEEFLAALAGETPLPVAAAFATFLDQPGLPRVQLDLDCTGVPALRLSQRRFLPAGADAEGTWQIPVCVRYPGDAGVRTSCTLLGTATATVPLEASTCPAWIVPDADARGYYRPVLPEAGVRALLDTPGVLSPVEQVAVLGDAGALIDVGELEPALLLERVPALVALGKPATTRVAARVVAGLDDHLVTDALRPAYEGWVRAQLGPLARELGFEATPGEDEDVALLRPLVVGVVGDAGADGALREEARRRVGRVLTDGRGVAPEMVGVTLELAALGGDRELYDRYRLALAADLPAEVREQVLAALPRFTDSALLRETLTLATDGALPLRDRVPLTFGLFGQRGSRDTAWELFREDPDAVAATVPGLFRKYVIYVGASFCDAEHRADVERTFARRARRYLGGRAVLAEVLETIDVCLATSAAQRPGVERFLEARP